MFKTQRFFSEGSGSTFQKPEINDEGFDDDCTIKHGATLSSRPS